MALLLAGACLCMGGAAAGRLRARVRLLRQFEGALELMERELSYAGTEVPELLEKLSGPTEAENHWYHSLKPGETFRSVPVAVAPTDGGFEDAVGRMTAYRRAVRRKNEDDEKLPVIFNDFMNCLGGDPTAEKEYPLIDAAAEIGCEYYTIDAGWYANGSWWSRVGEWEPARKRWPDGIDKVLSYIRQKGMVPGLWLEIEVIGIHCPMAEQLPDV